MKNIFVLLAAFLLAGAVVAKSYTAGELRAMVDGGSPPAQGDIKTETRAADFSTCTMRAAGVVASAGVGYPTRTLVDTDNLRVEKVWTNDGAVTVTCSRPDRKMTVTTAPYR